MGLLQIKWPCQTSCHFLLFKSDHLLSIPSGLIYSTCIVFILRPQRTGREEDEVKGAEIMGYIRDGKIVGRRGRENRDRMGGKKKKKYCLLETLQQQLSWGSSGLCSNLSHWALLHWGVVWSYNRNTTDTAASVGHACTATHLCEHTRTHACMQWWKWKCRDLLNTLWKYSVTGSIITGAKCA